MGASTAARNQVLDALATGTNVIAYISLHSADPGTTGASELSGGGYARQAITFSAASSGSKTNSTSAAFTTAGSTAATHFGLWTASTGGTYGLGGALTAPVTATSITVASGAIALGAS